MPVEEASRGTPESPRSRASGVSAIRTANVCAGKVSAGPLQEVACRDDSAKIKIAPITKKAKEKKMINVLRGIIRLMTVQSITRKITPLPVHEFDITNITM